MSGRQRSDRRAVVKFAEVAEFTDELARDGDLVERRIVRPSQEARAAFDGAFHHLLVHAGAVIDGQLVCLTAYAGQHWGDGMPEDEEGLRAGERAGGADPRRLRGRRARGPPGRLRGAAAMTPAPGRAGGAPVRTVLDARVLRALPMMTAPGSWPTAEQVAARLGLAVDVARSSLRRLDGRYLAEHDGGRPRRWARTARAEQALEWGP